MTPKTRLPELDWTTTVTRVIDPALIFMHSPRQTFLQIPLSSPGVYAEGGGKKYVITTEEPGFKDNSGGKKSGKLQ